MSEIHYFQRYTQKENVVTNNTMLLFSRLYHYSPIRFRDFLQEFLEDVRDLSPGIRFKQQVKAKKSVPDGIIEQDSFKVVIEAKLYDNMSHKQLVAHLDSFRNEAVQVLLLINPSLPSDDFMNRTLQDVAAYNQQFGKDVQFIARTFEQIIASFKNALRQDDTEMRDMLDDFESFCSEFELLQLDQYRLRALASGATYELNLKHGIYYDPADWGYQKHKYLGLYRNKSIKAIGEIENIVTADYDQASGLCVHESMYPVNSSQITAIEAIIRDSNAIYGWDISKNHKFFLVKGFHATDYRKTSKYPIQRSKYFNLKELFDAGAWPDVQQIARKLDGMEWSD